MIHEHPSWWVVDPSKLSTFTECPRRYFYQYVLGWSPSGNSIHLEFGSAWHLAMEHLTWKLAEPGYSVKTAIIEAHGLLTEYYRRFFGPELDDSHAPKNPARALPALVQWVQEYSGECFVPLYTEIAGSVPISQHRVLHFRMDAILEMEGLIRARDFKTAGQLSRSWIDQWHLSDQMMTYYHALRCLYPGEKVWGVEIDGAVFNKTKMQYHRVPVRPRPEMMNQWLWNANYHVDQIYENYWRLAEASEDDPSLEAFPQHRKSCTDYFGCPYFDFCLAWANPLRRCAETPFGFQIKFWDPRKERENAKVIFDL
jgi:hypothetical protein